MVVGRVIVMMPTVKGINAWSGEENMLGAARLPLLTKSKYSVGLRSDPANTGIIEMSVKRWSARDFENIKNTMNTGRYVIMEMRDLAIMIVLVFKGSVEIKVMDEKSELKNNTETKMDKNPPTNTPLITR